MKALKNSEKRNTFGMTTVNKFLPERQLVNCKKLFLI